MLFFFFKLFILLRVSSHVKVTEILLLVTFWRVAIISKLLELLSATKDNEDYTCHFGFELNVTSFDKQSKDILEAETVTFCGA